MAKVYCICIILAIALALCSVYGQQPQPIFDSDRPVSSTPSASQPADAIQNDGINFNGFFGELGAAIDKTSTGGLYFVFRRKYIQMINDLELETPKIIK